MTATLEDLMLPDDLSVDTTGDLYEQAAAVFSPCRRYRYALTRQWNADRPWLALVMLNPSTADAFRLDATVTRVRNRARVLNAGGLAVLNLFAVRATNPRDMRGMVDPVGPANDQIIGEFVRTLRPTVVAGWGTDIMVERTGRDRAVLRLLADANTAVYRIGPATAGGHPPHPLYLRSDLTLEEHHPVV